MCARRVAARAAYELPWVRETGDAMGAEAIFVAAILVMALVAGPLYMRMLAHGEKPDVWWRGRRNGSFTVGVALLVASAIAYTVGGIGAVTFAVLLAVSGLFLLSAGAACHVALRRLPARGEGA